jgi:hypothetical protein
MQRAEKKLQASWRIEHHPEDSESEGRGKN